MPLNTYVLAVTNPGAELGSMSGWTSNGNVSVRGTNPTPRSGSFYFMMGNSAFSWARQDIDITNDSANTDIDSNTAIANISWWQAGAASDNDAGAIQLRFLNNTGTVFLANTSVTRTQYDTTWTYRSVEADIPYGTRKIRIEMESARASGTNNDSYFDDISNIVINTGYANVNVAAIYAEVSGQPTQISNVNVTAIYVETSGQPTQISNVNVAAVYAEISSGISTANANVYQFYAEVIVGAILPRVLVAGGV